MVSSDLICVVCNYSCTKKSHMKQHHETEKHKKKMNELSQVAQPKQCICGKAFALRSSMFNHKKKCKILQSECYDNDDKKKEEELIHVKSMLQMLIKDHTTQTEMQHSLIIKNQEVLKEVTNQNKLLIETIQELTPKIGNGNTTMNAQLNVNLFLNNECKDAIRLSDFVKSLKITLKDLEYTKTNGIVEGISSIILNNLKGMDVHKRPIHCTDLKRETMYIKTDEWIKDDNNTHVKKFIYIASCYQTRIIQEWMDANPGWEMDEKMHIEYQTICKELYKNIESDDNAHKKIIKALVKEVHISKNAV